MSGCKNCADLGCLICQPRDGYTYPDGKGRLWIASPEQLYLSRRDRRKLFIKEDENTLKTLIEKKFEEEKFAKGAITKQNTSINDSEAERSFIPTGRPEINTTRVVDYNTYDIEILRLIDKNVEHGKSIALKEENSEFVDLFQHIQDLTELLVKKYGRSKTKRS